MKLNTTAVPRGTFKHTLPEYLGPGDVPCTITINHLPAGSTNPKFGELSQGFNIKVVAAELERNEMAKWNDRHQERAVRLSSIVEELAAERLAMYYDSCVVTWETNMLDDNKTLAPTRENFLALGDETLPALGVMFTKFIEACIKADEDERKRQDTILGN